MKYAPPLQLLHTTYRPASASPRSARSEAGRSPYRRRKETVLGACVGTQDQTHRSQLCRSAFRQIFRQALADDSATQHGSGHRGENGGVFRAWDL